MLDHRNEVPPQVMLLQMTTGYWISGALFVVAKLGIADMLKDEPKTCEELALSAGVDAPSLFRVMRALTSAGVFTQLKDGCFALTPMAKYLRSDIPGSVRAWAILQGEEWRWRAWGQLIHNVKTGQTAFEHVHHMRFFEYLDQHPEAAQIYHEAVGALDPLSTMGVMAVYDFSGIHTIVDVAGGSGGFLTTLLKAHPQMEGILFDQPSVIEAAKEPMEREGLAERCQLIGGNFFESIPTGGDAYILKQIIHVLDDESVVKVLNNCRQALTEKGKLLVIEQVIPPGNRFSFGKLLDLDMMVVLGGRVRTEAEHRELGEAAGLTLQTIISLPKGSSFSLMEFRPVRALPIPRGVAPDFAEAATAYSGPGGIQ